MPNSMKQELWWLALSVAAAILLGLVVGLPFVFLLLLLTGYCLWLLFRIYEIYWWVENGAERKRTPQTVGVMNDMVRVLHAEKKYSRRQKNKYRRALAQFNTLAERLPDASVVLDRHRQIVWANPAAQTLLQIRTSKDIGQRIDNLLRNPAFHEFLNTEDATAEMEMPSPMGADMTLGIRNVPAGRGMSVLIARDVTQRVKVRDMRKAFVADVSHELRTPLTVIQGYLELVQEDETLSGETRQGIDNVLKQSQRMHHIVEDLLQLSKMEGNPLAEDEGDPIMPASIIESIVAGLRNGLGKHHTFNLNLEQNLCLTGSESEVYGIFNNLIVNAVKYTDDGTHVGVSWNRDNDGKLVFQVKDDGAGIEARHLPRLSERFYRVDQGRSRERGGTGLGLAIVKHSAQRHGGQLLIHSVAGKGSTFTVEFPAHRASTVPTAVNL